jgi:hypothetical protein
MKDRKRRDAPDIRKEGVKKKAKPASRIREENHRYLYAESIQSSHYAWGRRTLGPLRKRGFNSKLRSTRSRVQHGFPVARPSRRCIQNSGKLPRAGSHRCMYNSGRDWPARGSEGAEGAGDSAYACSRGGAIRHSDSLRTLRRSHATDSEECAWAMSKHKYRRRNTHEISQCLHLFASNSLEAREAHSPDYCPPYCPTSSRSAAPHLSSSRRKKVKKHFLFLRQSCRTILAFCVVQSNGEDRCSCHHSNNGPG